jgi:hypothetical protein
MKPPKSLKWIIGSVILLGLVYLYPIVFPWSGLCCWTEEIGLNTGRKRNRSYLFWTRISETESPTWLSSMLSTHPPSPEDRWEPVNTMSPGVSFSPHYSYHGALAQITELEMCCERLSLSPNARLLLAEALINRWRRDGDYRGASSLILRPLSKLVRSGKHGNSTSELAVKQIVGRISELP